MPESSPPRPSGGDSGYDDEVDADGEELDDVDLWMPRESAGPLGETPQRGLKRSRNGQVREQSGMVDIARTMLKDAAPISKLKESDDLVLGTEDNMAKLDTSVQQWASLSLAERGETISLATAELAKLWNQQSDTKTAEGNIGPMSDEGTVKATYLSTLLLALHHPSTTKPPIAPQSHQRKALRLTSQSPQNISVPLPRALLDWVNTHHNPFPDEFTEIHLHQPSPAASSAFWDTIGSDTLRGRFQRVIRLLKDAGWQHAETAREDNGPRATGYRGRQLESIEEVVARCIKVLENSPALTDDDWNVAGPDWELFRQRVRHAVRDLDAYASAPTTSAVPEDLNAFTRANSDDKSMTASTNRAESRVPWSILQNLKSLYGILLGGKAVLDFAQDWLEGAVFLTVWWDGEENSVALDASLADMRISKLGAMKSLRRSAAGAGTREVDVAPLAAYRRKLGDMLNYILDEVDEFQPDSLDPVQVGLVSIIEEEDALDAVSVVIGMLRAWSATIASATVEIATLGGWLPQPEGRPSSSRGLMKDFSSENLMVLSYGPGAGQTQRSGASEGIDRDAVLTAYADLLAQKDMFRSQDGRVQREGWELGISVLSRLDDAQTSQERIRDILERIQVEDEGRVEKVFGACQSMGFGDLGRGIAEVRTPKMLFECSTNDVLQRYADTLASQSPPPYGKALIYYARAHATAKLKDTLSLLISLCLLQSAAMPPVSSLDPDLASLLNTERAALLSLARIDGEAAQLLGRWVSGFAMLRRFYEIRDQDVNPSASTTSKKMGSLERKREASKALIAVIEAAADCIKGGLFDPEVESVVPVEGVLVLLGEMLPLLGTGGAYGQGRIVSHKQALGLMSVVEDFEQISARLQDGANGLLGASMGAYRGESRSGRMAKSKSDVSNVSGSGSLGGSGSWEMLAESSFIMLQSTESAKSGRSSGNKGNAVQLERGWDWRKGLDAVAATGAGVGSKEVLMLLRTALAREVAQSWAGGIGK